MRAALLPPGLPRRSAAIMDWHELLPNVSVIMLAGAAFALYVASRLGVYALQCRGDSMGTRGIGPATVAQWLPIAAVAILALRAAPEVSVSVIFASSVACLSLVLGTMFFSAPSTGPLESRNRRAWGMVLPAAVLALLAGFAAEFTLKHAVIFALEGAVALMLWTTSSPIERVTTNEDAAHPLFSS